MGSRTSFLSLSNWSLNFQQNECSQSSQIYLSPKKLRNLSRKCLLFNLANFWMVKLTITSILPNCQVPNSFIIQKQLWKKKKLLSYLCQLEIDLVTQQPKETCQRTCRQPMYSSWDKMLKSSWTNHLNNILTCFHNVCYLKEKCSFSSYLFDVQQNFISFAIWAIFLDASWNKR